MGFIYCLLQLSCNVKESCSLYIKEGMAHAGKLFPGPHLYAGAAIVVLWAAASSLVPAMQKGNDTARNTHIALNTLNLALFAWQVRHWEKEKNPLSFVSSSRACCID